MRVEWGLFSHDDRECGRSGGLCLVRSMAGCRVLHRKDRRAENRFVAAYYEGSSTLKSSVHLRVVCVWCGGGVIESVQSGVLKLNATPSGYGPLTRGCCVDGVSCAVLRGYRCVYDSQVCGFGRSAWVQGVSEWRGVMLVSLRRVDVY